MLDIQAALKEIEEATRTCCHAGTCQSGHAYYEHNRLRVCAKAGDHQANNYKERLFGTLAPRRDDSTASGSDRVRKGNCMAELKTKETDASVDDFLNRIADETRRKDCFTVLQIMKAATRAEPRMWGASIVGFGTYHYKYASGREGDWPIIGFSPRKQDLTLYIGSGFARHAELLAKLGKCKTAKSCLYIKRLADVDLPVLKELVSASVKHSKQTHNK